MFNNSLCVFNTEFLTLFSRLSWQKKYAYIRGILWRVFFTPCWITWNIDFDMRNICKYLIGQPWRLRERIDFALLFIHSPPPSALCQFFVLYFFFFFLLIYRYHFFFFLFFNQSWRRSEIAELDSLWNRLRKSCTLPQKKRWKQMNRVKFSRIVQKKKKGRKKKNVSVLELIFHATLIYFSTLDLWTLRNNSFFFPTRFFFLN